MTTEAPAENTFVEELAGEMGALLKESFDIFRTGDKDAIAFELIRLRRDMTMIEFKLEAITAALTAR